MYKIITINGEDYKLEFSIEASLYHECIEKITGVMFDIDSGQTTNDYKQLLSGMSDIPNTTVICFYAGLLEHHGTDEGDGKVPNLSTAKRLAKSLLRDENSEVDNFYDLFSICIDQMGEDGFFDLIGLPSMLGVEKKKEPKKPQDHKKKVTKVGEN